MCPSSTSVCASLHLVVDCELASVLSSVERAVSNCEASGCIALCVACLRSAEFFLCFGVRWRGGLKKPSRIEQQKLRRYP